MIDSSAGFRYFAVLQNMPFIIPIPRLLYCEPELKVFDPRRTGFPDEQFLLSIFRDERAFSELVKVAKEIQGLSCRYSIISLQAINGQCTTCGALRVCSNASTRLV